MELSQLVAQIISIIYLSLGVGIILRTVDFQFIIDEMVKSPVMLFLSGSIATSIGLVLVQQHNIWVSDWRIIITLISWGLFSGGVLLLAVPKWYIYIVSLYRKVLRNSIGMGLFMVAFGLLLAYFGFVL